MSRTLYFISHPEVQISATIPVTQWHLSDKGRTRFRQMLSLPWISELTSIYCSDEQKAIDGAEMLAEHTSLPFHQIAGLGENDRSSTGFLEPGEFELTANEFFSHPEQSIRGWETAVAAQSRIVNAVMALEQNDNTDGAIAIISHGAVGTLLYCHLANKPIDRQWDQPGQGGGNYMVAHVNPDKSCTWWKPID